jgi:hypothetical protein
MGWAALSFFRHTATAHIKDPPELPHDDEAQMITRARLGGLQYSAVNAGDEPVEYEAIGFDINSCYPAAASSKAPLPWKRGEWKSLDCNLQAAWEKNRFISVGLYRIVPCTLFRDRAYPGRRFVTSLAGGDGKHSDTILTHHDLVAWCETAETGLVPWPVLVEGQNAYLYGPSARKPQSRLVFGQTIDKLMKFKYQNGEKCYGVKMMPNALIGSLDEKNDKKRIVVTEKENKKLPMNARDIAQAEWDVDFETGTVNDLEMWYQPKNTTFLKYPGWARCSVFIKAKARLETARTIRKAAGPRGDSVVRLHTDGWTQTEMPDVHREEFMEELDGERLGGVKIEHDRGKMVLYHLNKQEWN